MIVSNSRRFIFVHVPKAAGTSVTHELSRFTTFRDVEVGGTPYGETLQNLYSARFGLRKHSTGAEIRDKAGPEVWRGFFVFGFVRNPYARAYSLWKFLRRWTDGPQHQIAAERDFDGFVADERFGAAEIDITRPQADWLTKAGEPLPGIDFIGRVERFDQDFSFVLSTISRRPIAYQTSARQNVSAEADEWREAMTPLARRRIETVYARDFETFGYPAI